MFIVQLQIFIIASPSLSIIALSLILNYKCEESVESR